MHADCRDFIIILGVINFQVVDDKNDLTYEIFRSQHVSHREEKKILLNRFFAGF